MTNTLTNADIWLMVRLRHEMKRQNNDGTAQPVYWQIMQKQEIDASDNCADGFKIVYVDGDVFEMDTVSELIEYIDEELEDMNQESDYADMLEELSMLGEHDLDEAYSIIREHDYMNSENFDVVAYRKEDVIKNGPIFLLKEEARQHIKLNKHHYNDTVHTWGAHAWRSGSFELLHNLLMSDKVIIDDPLTKRYELFCSVVPASKKLPYDAPDEFFNLIRQAERNVLKNITGEELVELTLKPIAEIKSQCNLDETAAKRLKSFGYKIMELNEQEEPCISPYNERK